ncbi:hypothetical protein PAPYR_8966 [Paratrimastix pyriformis]|uniref:Fungal lipase-type domain-containing protein n=1 Tax=Paratrimastix pyriformis TaxID=342808 RepID=A0ABQ8UEZ0_9EUKA|nr:hypothetical protein PAPYR_8966 [Paratrimastix pyriformis]
MAAHLELVRLAARWCELAYERVEVVNPGETLICALPDYKVIRTGGRLIIAFKGTDSPGQLLTALEAARPVVPSTQDGDGEANNSGSFHSGFLGKANEFICGSDAILAGHALDGIGQILLTGHSLGGAVSITVAYLLMKGQKIPRQCELVVVTFGSPPAFEQKIADELASFDHPARFIRVCNTWDPVPWVGIKCIASDLAEIASMFCAGRVVGSALNGKVPLFAVLAAIATGFYSTLDFVHVKTGWILKLDDAFDIFDIMRPHQIATYCEFVAQPSPGNLVELDPNSDNGSICLTPNLTRIASALAASAGALSGYYGCAERAASPPLLPSVDQERPARATTPRPVVAPTPADHSPTAQTAMTAATRPLPRDHGHTRPTGAVATPAPHGHATTATRPRPHGPPGQEPR